MQQKNWFISTTLFHFAPLSTTLIPILYHAWVDCKEIMKNFFRALFLCPPKKPFRQYSPTIDTVTTISPHPLYFVNPDAIFHKRQTKKRTRQVLLQDSAGFFPSDSDLFSNLLLPIRMHSFFPTPLSSRKAALFSCADVSQHPHIRLPRTECPPAPGIRQSSCGG